MVALNGLPTGPELVAGQVSVTMAAMLTEQPLVAVVPVPSFTWTLKLPAARGVPLMAPVEGLIVRPFGRVPTTEYVYVGLPPVAWNWLLNGAPTSPVMFPGQGSKSALEIVNVQLVAVAPSLSVTLIENVAGPCGVPLTSPVEGFKVRPVGSAPTATENV
jgi:hypothetical protein